MLTNCPVCVIIIKNSGFWTSFFRPFCPEFFFCALYRNRFREQLNRHRLIITVRSSYRHCIRLLNALWGVFFIDHLFIFGRVFSPSEALLRAYTSTINVIVRSNATEDGCRRTTSAPLQDGAPPRTRLRTVRKCRADRFFWRDRLWFPFRRLRAMHLLVFYDDLSF